MISKPSSHNSVTISHSQRDDFVMKSRYPRNYRNMRFC